MASNRLFFECECWLALYIIWDVSFQESGNVAQENLAYREKR